MWLISQSAPIRWLVLTCPLLPLTRAHDKFSLALTFAVMSAKRGDKTIGAPAFGNYLFPERSQSPQSGSQNQPSYGCSRRELFRTPRPHACKKSTLPALDEDAHATLGCDSRLRHRPFASRLVKLGKILLGQAGGPLFSIRLRGGPPALLCHVVERSGTPAAPSWPNCQ